MFKYLKRVAIALGRTVQATGSDVVPEPTAQDMRVQELEDLVAQAAKLIERRHERDVAVSKAVYANLAIDYLVGPEQVENIALVLFNSAECACDCPAPRCFHIERFDVALADALAHVDEGKPLAAETYIKAVESGEIGIREELGDQTRMLPKDDDAGDDDAPPKGRLLH